MGNVLRVKKRGGSVPVLITSSDATTSRQASTLPSVMNVFKNAGFRVYWLSTQMKHGFWDTRCSTYAHDADEAQFLSGKLALSGEPADAAHDSELIKAAQKILDRGESKVLIVLHTMGSHAVYSDRYPPEFNRFPSDPATCTKARKNLFQSTFTPEDAAASRKSGGTTRACGNAAFIGHHFHTLIDLAGLSRNFFKPVHSVASKNFQPRTRMVTALDGTLAKFACTSVLSSIKEARKQWRKPLTIRGIAPA